MRTVVVLTGAGISAESGLRTFRGDGGLWQGRRVEEVATPGAWAANPGLVLEFYNERRRQVRDARPNVAHAALADLETAWDVHVITQNVDDLHERAGSSRVLHLHGEIMRARSTVDPAFTPHLGAADILLGDTCPRGGQLRPHVVWFGEMVPAMEEAESIAARADVFLCVGTSLAVQPAASLVFAAPRTARRIVVDPDIPPRVPRNAWTCVATTACAGVPEVVADLLRAAGV
jgi:NAD-dependent deacetylase